jgi:hypothetical protein
MDRLLNMIACDERVQICSQSTKLCLAWSGLYPVPDLPSLVGGAGDDPKLQSELTAASAFLVMYLPTTSVPESIADRDGATALRAARYMQQSAHFYLEPEQWKTELKSWFSLALARLQLGIFHSVERPSYTVNATLMKNTWEGTPLMRLCGRIKYRSNGHMSLSFFGFMTVVVVSVLLIGLSFFEMFLDRPLRKWSPDRMSHWDRAENLALLRDREEKTESEAVSEEPVESDRLMASPNDRRSGSTATP